MNDKMRQMFLKKFNVTLPEEKWSVSTKCAWEGWRLAWASFATMSTERAADEICDKCGCLVIDGKCWCESYIAASLPSREEIDAAYRGGCDAVWNQLENPHESDTSTLAKAHDSGIDAIHALLADRLGKPVEVELPTRDQLHEAMSNAGAAGKSRLVAALDLFRDRLQSAGVRVRP